MIRLVPLALLSAALIACSGDDTTTDSATTGVTDSGTTGGTDSGTTIGTDSGTTADSGTTGPTDSGGPPSDVDGDGFSVDEGDCDDDDDGVRGGWFRFACCKTVSGIFLVQFLTSSSLPPLPCRHTR